MNTVSYHTVNRVTGNRGDSADCFGNNNELNNTSTLGNATITIGQLLCHLVTLFAAPVQDSLQDSSSLNLRHSPQSKHCQL